MESITLDAEPGSVGIARRFLLDRFAERDLDSSVAVLLASELVSNVVRHARTELTLGLAFDPCVRVEVHDGVAATEAFREILVAAEANTPVDSPGGRGLPLVRGLATRFGLDDEPTGDGKVVWFELAHTDLAIRQLTDS